MAKKKENKKALPKAKVVTKKAKPEKKATKPAKPAKKVATKPVKKASKPATKNVINKTKKVAKPASKAAAKPEKGKKESSKDLTKKVNKAPAETKKPVGKPIDAIAKKGKDKKADKKSAKKKGKSSDDDDDEDVAEEEEEEEDSDVDVKDDYEKPDEDDAVIEAGLDEAGLIDIEGAPAPDLDEDEDEIPEKRGRGRRKKNEGKSSGSSMEAYIRNRPLQIDINKPLIKKGNVVAPKPFLNTDDKRSRYSDKELAEFKELILDKLKEAQTDYDLLKQTLSNEDNHGTDDTSPSFKLLEDGSDVMSKEETAQLASRQEKYIVNLKNALVRIENKSYGICRVTGKLIPKERLRSVPHATLGIDAKLSQ